MRGADEVLFTYTGQIRNTWQYHKAVIVCRPAYLYNGFDFVVCVENTNFSTTGKKRRNYPTHEDILIDLSKKYTENRLQYKKLLSVLEKVYRCEMVDETEYNIYFSNGFPSDLILKTLKWLFIEQDIRYWNYSGRDMLWTAIINISQ